MPKQAGTLLREFYENKLKYMAEKIVDVVDGDLPGKVSSLIHFEVDMFICGGYVQMVADRNGVLTVMMYADKNGRNCVLPASARGYDEINDLLDIIIKACDFAMHSSDNIEYVAAYVKEHIYKNNGLN